MINWKRVAKVQRSYWLATEQELREAIEENRRLIESNIHPDNPKPQTYEAAMMAYEGACVALREAMRKLAAQANKDA